MRKTKKTKKKPCCSCMRQHLPEWRDLFGDLRREAEERYPDGRLRVVVPPDEEDDEE